MKTTSDKAQKRPYSAPKLTVYGDMVALTKAGTGSTREQVAGQGPTTKRP